MDGDVWHFSFFFLMIRRPPRSTLFPTRRSSDLARGAHIPFMSTNESALDRLSVRRKNLVASVQKQDRKSTRLNSSHANISYAVFCLKKKSLTSIPRSDMAPLGTPCCGGHYRLDH